MAIPSRFARGTNRRPRRAEVVVLGHRATDESAASPWDDNARRRRSHAGEVARRQGGGVVARPAVGGYVCIIVVSISKGDDERKGADGRWLLLVLQAAKALDKQLHSEYNEV